MPESPSAPLRWHAYEHEHFDRGSDWFWALGVIAVSAGLTSILFGNVLFALLIVVAAITIALIAKHPPEAHEFEISHKGVRAGKTFYRYESIISFWVETETQEPLLLIDTTALMAPNLVIPIGDTDPELIRSHLQKHVPEVPMQEPLTHKIMEYFGF